MDKFWFIHERRELATAAHVDRMARGETTCTLFGKPTSTALETRAQWDAYTAAKHDRVLHLAPPQSAYIPERWLWYVWCWVHNLPCIVVTPLIGCATLELDLSTVHIDGSDPTHLEPYTLPPELVATIERVLRVYGVPGERPVLTTNGGAMHRVPLADLPPCVNRLLALLLPAIEQASADDLDVGVFADFINSLPMTL